MVRYQGNIIASFLIAGVCARLIPAAVSADQPLITSHVLSEAGPPLTAAPVYHARPLRRDDRTDDKTCGFINSGPAKGTWHFHPRFPP